jgi:hypothetical protein
VNCGGNRLESGAFITCVLAERSGRWGKSMMVGVRDQGCGTFSRVPEDLLWFTRASERFKV